MTSTQNTQSKSRVVVLISGNGSNLQAILNAAANDNCPFVVSAVISNKQTAYGLQRADLAGVANHWIEHDHFSSRAEFDQALMQTIDLHQPDVIVLAGFMRILTAEFVHHYQGQLLNIHPSLLPKYRGLHTHKNALESGDKVHGASVHFVTEELDGGPVILQTQIAINADDSPESLATRLLEKEHKIYPLVLNWYATGRVSMQHNQVLFDHQPLEEPLQFEQLTSD